MKCSECNKRDEDSCVQWLGEACGWQWWPRTKNSWRDCWENKNLTEDEKEALENKMKRVQRILVNIR